MRRFLVGMGRGLGWLLWTLHVRRGVIMDNLRLAFPEWTEAKRREVGKRTFVNIGQMALEFLLVTKMTPAELDRMYVYDPHMKEVALAALRSGRPVVVCTAHFGNFENLAAVHNMQGYRIAMVVRRMGAGWFGRFWNRGRSRAGLEVLEVTRGETLKAAQRAMRQGKVLGYVIDQNMPGHRAIFPTFFGVPAATAPTPAYLAMRSKRHRPLHARRSPRGRAPPDRHGGAARAPRHRRPRGRRPRLRPGPERPAGALGPALPRPLVLAPPQVEDAPSRGRGQEAEGPAN